MIPVLTLRGATAADSFFSSFLDRFEYNSGFINISSLLLIFTKASSNEFISRLISRKKEGFQPILRLIKIYTLRFASFSRVSNSSGNLCVSVKGSVTFNTFSAEYLTGVDPFMRLDIVCK